MDRITKGYMNNFALSQELHSTLDESKIFEMFACYCVLSREYADSFDLSDIVTGGGSDGGIDGIAIIANNVLIHSPEEFDDLVEQTHSITDLKFIFVQAKTSSFLAEVILQPLDSVCVIYLKSSPKWYKVIP